MPRNVPTLSALLGAAVCIISVHTAEARQCTRLAFSVNDYGKEGPTKDAMRLLDSYAKKWTSERGIKAYTVGKKTVSCELFLDFIVFDEHTCKAQASVCWGGGTSRAASAMVRSAAGEADEDPLKKAVSSGPAVLGTPSVKPR